MVGDNYHAAAWSFCTVSRLAGVKLKFVADSLRWIGPWLFVTMMSACATGPVERLDKSNVLRTDNEVIIGDAKRYGLVADEIDRGVRIFLPKLTFGYNSVDLSAEAKRKIVYIAKILDSDMASQRGIVIAGHADSLGATQNNLKISKYRAEEVTVRLEGHGVDRQRISQEWYGDGKPIIPNTLVDGSDNPEGRAVNRRVEVIILNP